MLATYPRCPKDFAKVLSVLSILTADEGAPPPGSLRPVLFSADCDVLMEGTGAAVASGFTVNYNYYIGKSSVKWATNDLHIVKITYSL